MAADFNLSEWALRNRALVLDSPPDAGAGEITDLVDNLVIVWRNLRKDDKPDTPSSDPDAYMRVAKQRHHSWEGSFSFWFDKASQQFLEFEAQRPTFVDVGRAYA